MHADVHSLIQPYLLSDYCLSSIVLGARYRLVNKKGVPACMKLIFWQDGEDSHHCGGGIYILVGVRLG